MQFVSAVTSEPLIFLEHLFTAGEEGGRWTLTDITVQLKHTSGSDWQSSASPRPLDYGAWALSHATVSCKLKEKIILFVPWTTLATELLIISFFNCFSGSVQFSSASAESQPGWIWISAEPESLLVQCSFLVMIHKLTRNQNAIKIDEYKDYFFTLSAVSFPASWYSYL